ncbi:MAG: ABC transporter ATP-binding protein [Deltaproteobacteria bacterium]|nr:ABC transporter ATP-binding protein [Deltaproteobacteria bacterium]
MKLIELLDVSKVYGRGGAETRALDGIDLAIDAGEFVAVMGTSGSGKSTCMNILGCLDKPTHGRYLFRGVDVSKLDRDERALLRRRHLGFIFQSFNLLARTSALENVELPLVYRGLRKAERRRLALAQLDAVGLSDRVHHTPAELSGGQQQRVAIARALVTSPSIIFADEPTGNLDSRNSQEILTLLSGLHRERGITIVMVTHEPELAALADRVVVFRDGRIVSESNEPEPSGGGGSSRSAGPSGESGQPGESGHSRLSGSWGPGSELRGGGAR